jgi:hypothetical protein
VDKIPDTGNSRSRIGKFKEAAVNILHAVGNEILSNMNVGKNQTSADDAQLSLAHLSPITYFESINAPITYTHK